MRIFLYLCVRVCMERVGIDVKFSVPGGGIRTPYCVETLPNLLFSCFCSFGSMICARYKLMFRALFEKR